MKSRPAIRPCHKCGCSDEIDVGLWWAVSGKDFRSARGPVSCDMEWAVTCLRCEYTVEGAGTKDAAICRWNAFQDNAGKADTSDRPNSVKSLIQEIIKYVVGLFRHKPCNHKAAVLMSHTQFPLVRRRRRARQ